MSTSPTVDFTDPQAVELLYPTLKLLQSHQPVAWLDQLQGWVITRYADVAAALRNPALSSRRVDVMAQAQFGSNAAQLLPDYERITRVQMLFCDADQHHRLRVLGNRGFTPSMLQRAVPLIEAVVDDLLDRAVMEGHMDVVADFSQPLPSRVIAELFAIPAADQTWFQQRADDILAFTGFSQGNPLNEARQANEGMRELEDYFLHLLRKRSAALGNDLMSLLLAGQAEGRLSAEEVCAQCILILVAGHVTTIDQLANMVFALLTHRRQWDTLCRQPSLVASAVEESLRYDPAVTFIQRLVVAPTNIGGRDLPVGTGVWLSPAAANRDPSVFANPEQFDIQRSGLSHLSFGAGPHVCLGAGLARRELQIALHALVKRFPRLRLSSAGAQRRCGNLVFRGFRKLPVDLA